MVSRVQGWGFLGASARFAVKGFESLTIPSAIGRDWCKGVLKKENNNVIIYYNKSLNEGLIGIIAARLKDYFNKPAIVITKSNNVLKGSARSTPIYNIGNLIKKLIDKKIIISGGGHNMAAGFTITKEKINLLDKFIQNNYSYNV